MDIVKKLIIGKFYFFISSKRCYGVVLPNKECYYIQHFKFHHTKILLIE